MLLWAPQTAASSAGRVAQNQHLLSHLEEQPGLTAVATKAKCERDMSFKCTAEVASVNHCNVESWALWGLMWQWTLTSDQFCFILGNSVARSQVKKANSLHTWPFLFPKLKPKHLVFFYLKKSQGDLIKKTNCGGKNTSIIIELWTNDEWKLYQKFFGKSNRSVIGCFVTLLPSSG